MFGIFKSKSEKILDEIVAFRTRLDKGLDPLMARPKKPLAAQGSLTSMSVNVALYFLAAGNSTIFQKEAPRIISHMATAYGSVVSEFSSGNVDAETAAMLLLREMKETQGAYFGALKKSSADPEYALQDCLNIFIRSADGWDFTGEAARAAAVILLASELQGLMQRFQVIL